MRDWNYNWWRIASSFPPFLSYLWGIETNFRCWMTVGVLAVFIVPMRDWNTAIGALLGGRVEFSFYRTYEGLKHFRQKATDRCSCTFLSYLWGIETHIISKGINQERVFIVPMRDWNSNSLMRWRGNWMFLSYLWGIETEINEAPNVQVAVFLSYLWGIETNDAWWLESALSRFYRTYEGLKHLFNS